MTNPEPRCRFETEIIAYLQDELPPEARGAFEEHLAACPSCPAEIEAYRRLIHRLTATVPDVPQGDLAAGVLRRLEVEKRMLRARFAPALLRAAAALIIFVLAGILLTVMRPKAMREEAPTAAPGAARERFVAAALDWLQAAQEPQGHWDAARWGGERSYTPGLSALAVLALLQHDPDAFRGPRTEAVRRGVEYLLTQQSPDGRFGPLCKETPYNHGLATLAVLRAARRHGDPRWVAAADRALAYIKSTQLLSGGWGYARPYGDVANTSVTAWQLQALLEARDAGRSDLRPQIHKGLAWLARMMDPEGRVGYTRPGDFPNGHLTLTAAAALCFLREPSQAEPAGPLAQALAALRRDADPAMEVDYYRYYFIVPALAAAGDEAAPLVSRLRETLQTCQAASGEQVGSCELSDRWSSAGGRVYATAMAALAM